MELYPYFKSILDQDTAAVVVCNMEHKIIYMNPASCRHYARFGGESLFGKNLLDCHNPRSRELICKVLDWFRADMTHNRVHTFYNSKENKDVYMIALRDQEGSLIGYYEKHEYRDRDETPLYCMN